MRAAAAVAGLAMAAACGRVALEPPGAGSGGSGGGGAAGGGGSDGGGVAGAAGGAASGAGGSGAGTCVSLQAAPPVVFTESPRPVVWTGQSYVTTWVENMRDPRLDPSFTLGFELRVAMFGTDGVVISRFAAYRETPTDVAGVVELQAATAAAPGEVGFVWCRAEPGAIGGRLFVARMADDGSLTMPTPVGACSLQNEATLTFDGAGFGVAWNCTNLSICFARVTGDGMPIGATTEIRLTGLTFPLLSAWLDDRYAVYWTEVNAALSAHRFATLSAQGAMLGGGVSTISDAAGFAHFLQIAPAPGGFVAAWEQADGLMPIADAGAMWATYDRDGMIAGAITRLADPLVALASGGDRYAALVAHATTPTTFGLALLDVTGTPVAAEIPIAFSGRPSAPVLHWHGTGYGLHYGQVDAATNTPHLAYRRFDCR